MGLLDDEELIDETLYKEVVIEVARDPKKPWARRYKKVLMPAVETITDK